MDFSKWSRAEILTAVSIACATTVGLLRWLLPREKASAVPETGDGSPTVIAHGSLVVINPPPAPTPSPTLPQPSRYSNLPTAQLSVFYTDHGDTLGQLARAFEASRTVALTQAVAGLGGVGKTQAALKYASDHTPDYDATFWVLAETEASLRTGLAGLAAVLHLPEATAREQDVQVEAVKRWLTENARWLLVLDNVEDSRMVAGILPSGHAGHVLVTSRHEAQVALTAKRTIEVGVFKPEEGQAFLAKRIDRGALPAEESAAADDIVKTLGGLALALEQAGAYVRETGISLAAYADVLAKQLLKSLEKSDPEAGAYEKSVALTWLPSFDAVEKASPAAADGTGAAASFAGLDGLAFDGASNLYVADAGNGTIRKVDVETGEVTTVAGVPDRLVWCTGRSRPGSTNRSAWPSAPDRRSSSATTRRTSCWSCTDSGARRSLGGGTAGVAVQLAPCGDRWRRLET